MEKQFIVDGKLLQAVCEYLARRPWVEVNALLAALSAAKSTHEEEKKD